MDTSCDHLLHLDSPSFSSELQDNSIIESTEDEPVPYFEAYVNWILPVSHPKTHPALTLNFF